ncbi:unnamed protein product, partial [Chrysoparadoxa australica]
LGLDTIAARHIIKQMNLRNVGALFDHWKNKHVQANHTARLGEKLKVAFAAESFTSELRSAGCSLIQARRMVKLFQQIADKKLEAAMSAKKGLADVVQDGQVDAGTILYEVTSDDTDTEGEEGALDQLFNESDLEEEMPWQLSTEGPGKSCNTEQCPAKSARRDSQGAVVTLTPTEQSLASCCEDAAQLVKCRLPLELVKLAA